VREPVENADPVEAITLGDRKCSRRPIPGQPYKVAPCNAEARARVDGCFVCGNHLAKDGMWVNSGVVWKWVLEPTGEEE
jgi:hypothetical protein